MEGKQITVYDFHNEIQPKLCEYIGIHEDNFRRYERVVGGKYKDFWHVFLTMYDVNGNDSYFDMHDCEDYEYITEQIVDEFGDWAVALILAVIELHEQYGERLHVWVSW